jgi:sporulation protein YlmC with PRC-barrel domain
MRPGKDLTGKQIISIVDGRFLGTVKDIYMDDDLRGLTGLFVGSEGLIKRKSLLIPRDAVVVFGVDAMLVKNADVITDDQSFTEAEKWIRLSKLKGREIGTPGGTKVGTVGDITIGEDANITGFILARVNVEGPVAEQGYIPRHALFNSGSIDGVISIDLTKAENPIPPAKTEEE